MRQAHWRCRRAPWREVTELKLCPPKHGNMSWVSQMPWESGNGRSRLNGSLRRRARKQTSNLQPLCQAATARNLCNGPHANEFAGSVICDPRRMTGSQPTRQGELLPACHIIHSPGDQEPRTTSADRPLQLCVQTTSAAKVPYMLAVHFHTRTAPLSPVCRPYLSTQRLTFEAQVYLASGWALQFDVWVYIVVSRTSEFGVISSQQSSLKIADHCP